MLHYQPKIDVRARAHGGRRGADALAARRPAGAAGRLHPAGRGDRPDRAAVGVGAARGGAPGPHLAAGASASPTRSPSTCPAACSSAATWSSTSTSASPRYSVPHRVILLEITEDNLMKDLQNVIPSLHRLNEIGVEISIDDFGTGYSSLAYLTTLPISELKIDRSFVRDLGITPQSSAVVTAIIALARSLGPARDRRGRRDAAPDGGAAPPGLRRDAGLPVQPRRCRPTNCERWLRADRAAAQGAVDRRGRRGRDRREATARSRAGVPALTADRRRWRRPGRQAAPRLRRRWPRRALRRLGARRSSSRRRENYARACAEEAGAGVPAAATPRGARGQAWAALDRARWCAASSAAAGSGPPRARKDSLQRVLRRQPQRRRSGCSSGCRRCWRPGSTTGADGRRRACAVGGAAGIAAATRRRRRAAAVAPRPPRRAVDALRRHRARRRCRATTRARAELADRLARLAGRIAARGRDGALRGARSRRCAEARGACSRTATTWSTSWRAVPRARPQGLTELAEDDSWARGQCESAAGAAGRAA
ncbi:MAG: EAL domain-containing protein [Comamonadaceae bacterium]|nr:EAL domain-containing protein [Comamonadaceae bacterium]